MRAFLCHQFSTATGLLLHSFDHRVILLFVIADLARGVIEHFELVSS